MPQKKGMRLQTCIRYGTPRVTDEREASQEVRQQPRAVGKSDIRMMRFRRDLAITNFA